MSKETSMETKGGDMNDNAIDAEGEEADKNQNGDIEDGEEKDTIEEDDRKEMNEFAEESSDVSSDGENKDDESKTEEFTPDPICVRQGKPSMVYQDCPSAYYDLSCDYPNPPENNEVPR